MPRLTSPDDFLPLKPDAFYVLLDLYPARFRRAFAQDLIETFRDRRRDAARGGVSAASFWLSTMHDVITQGVAERVTSAVRALRPNTIHGESLMTVLSNVLRS